MISKKRIRTIWLVICSLFIIGIGGWFFLLPGVRVSYAIATLDADETEPPRFAYSLHRKLAPRYAAWARQRVASGRAAKLTTEDLVETEWPVFGSVFFLWGTEQLQKAWEMNRALSPVAPKEYAAEAIDAAAALIADPNHGTWVRDHWGNDYLHDQNAFYRMMLIGGLTSHYNLTGNAFYLPIVKDQVESLAAELDATPHGWIEDYPGECYPADVLAAVACIRRADEALGTDHSEFAARMLRGFSGDALDEMGLVPFLGYARLGEAIGPSRGSGNSYASLMLPELWPDQAEGIYRRYERYFWNDNGYIVGFREHAPAADYADWEYADMDSGPIVGGFGMAASAFGVGAARRNGRYDHAYPLAAEMIAASWPLPDGTLLAPRLMSHALDAPYLGEACIMYNLAQRPAARTKVRFGGSIPPFVYACLAVYYVVGLFLLYAGTTSLVRVISPAQGLAKKGVRGRAAGADGSTPEGASVAQ